MHLATGSFLLLSGKYVHLEPSTRLMEFLEATPESGPGSLKAACEVESKLASLFGNDATMYGEGHSTLCLCLGPNNIK